LGVRYIIADNNEPGEKVVENDSLKAMMSRYYEICATTPYHNAYYNPYALSLAYGVSSDIKDFAFKNESDKDIYSTPYHKLNAVISSMMGVEDMRVFKEFSRVEVTTSNCDLGYADKHTKYSPEDSAASAYVIYTLNVDRSGDVYFYLPSSYPREVELSLNGDAYGTFYGSDTNRTLLLGYFEAGETITLKMKLKASVLYVKNDVECFYYLDDTVFENAINTLSATQLVIDDEFTDDHITGELLTNTEDQTILTTIPYDEGWIVKIDGKEIEYYKTLDALIAFDIDDIGEHEVEFIYRSKPFVLGMICTVSFILLFAVLVMFEKPIYKFIYAKLYDEYEDGEISDPEEIEPLENEDVEECNGYDEPEHFDPPSKSNQTLE
jgi:uncharacterized membrane protein YfhO